MRRLILPAIAMVALTLSACVAPDSTGPGARPSLARTNTTKSNEWIAVPPTTVTDPCSGEDVILSGKIHEVLTVTDNGDGTSMLTAHLNYAGITGYGVTSGLKYNLVATDKETDISTLVGYSTTIQQQVGLISQGSSDNYKSHILVEYGFDGVDFTSVTLRDNTTCG